MFWFPAKRIFAREIVAKKTLVCGFVFRPVNEGNTQADTNWAPARHGWEGGGLPLKYSRCRRTGAKMNRPVANT